MEAPDEVMDEIAGADQGEAEERRLPEVEAALAIGMAELREPPLALVFGKGTPVLLAPRQGHPAVDHLDGVRHVLPVEARAQRRVMLEHMRPGTLEWGGLQPTVKRADELPEVEPLLWLIERVEEDSFLHRRKPVDRFQVFRFHRNAPC